jgi:hypothetical protein
LLRVDPEVYRGATVEVVHVPLPPFLDKAMREQERENSRRSALLDARRYAEPRYLTVRVPRLTITWARGKQRRRLEWVTAR